MGTVYLIISTIALVGGAAFFCIFGSIYLLWIILVLLSLICWKKTNYSTTRIFALLLLLVVTLCGETNYLMYYALVDFAITIIIVIFNDYKIPRHYVLTFPWAILLIVGIIGGTLFATDKTSFHIGVEVYFLLMLLLLSTEFLNSIESTDFSAVKLAICAANGGVLALFWGSNTVTELVVKSRALIYLLGDSGIRSNTLAGIIITFLVALFVSRRTLENIISKIVVYIIMILDLIVLIFLQSRGAYVALFTVILVGVVENIIAVKTVHKMDVIKIVTLGIIIGILLLLPESQNIISTYIFGRFFSDNADISNGRFELYRASMEMWGNHLLFGNGFLQFNAFKIKNADPHNWILGYLASVGIVGTIGFIIFLMRIFKPDNTCGIMSKAFRYAVFAQIIHGLFEPVLTQNLPLSLFVTICILTYMSKKNEKNLRIKLINR